MKTFFEKYAEEIKRNNLDVEFIEEEDILRTPNNEFYMEFHIDGNYTQIHRKSTLVFMPLVTIKDCKLDIYANSIYIAKND